MDYSFYANQPQMERVHMPEKAGAQENGFQLTFES